MKTYSVRLDGEMTSVVLAHAETARDARDAVQHRLEELGSMLRVDSNERTTQALTDGAAQAMREHPGCLGDVQDLE